MAIQIRSDKKETVNKTIRFPTEMLDRIDHILMENNVTFTGFVIQAVQYVLDELEVENGDK